MKLQLQGVTLLKPRLHERAGPSAHPRRLGLRIVAREAPRMLNLRGTSGRNSSDPQQSTGSSTQINVTQGRNDSNVVNLGETRPNIQSAPGTLPGQPPRPAPGSLAQPPSLPASQPVPIFVPKTISLFDAFKFNGPAPELIQGRLAMVGFVIGASKESETGLTILQQATNLGAPQIIGLLLIVVASLQPITKAAKSEAFGIFTPRAEITNGRAAMLGFAALLALEWNAGVCFF